MPRRYGSLLAVLIAAQAVTGCSDLGDPIRPRAISVVSVSTLDFGTVAVSGSATRSLTVQNAGTAALTGRAALSCAGYEVVTGGGEFSIPPGESRTIVVRFSPGSVGDHPCTLELGPNCPQVTMQGSAATQLPGAECVLFPDSVDFGILPVGQTKARTFRIVSSGTAALLVNVVSNSDEYRVVSGGGLAEIPAGGGIDVVVDFRPQAGRIRRGVISVGPGCPDVGAKGVGTTVSLKNHIRPIFAARCNESCHYHYFTNETDGYSNALVYYCPPFDTTNSYLYARITNAWDCCQMPPPPAPLIPQEERDTFRDWIMEGATNN